MKKIQPHTGHAVGKGREEYFPEKYSPHEEWPFLRKKEKKGMTFFGNYGYFSLLLCEKQTNFLKENWKEEFEIISEFFVHC